MALIRVAQYNSTPTLVTDYQAQNAHLQAFTNQLMTQQFILNSGTAQPIIKQGCYVSHGGSLYVADADTSITGSPSDGSVYIRVSGTTSLTVEFVTDISGYAWNPVYTALTSGSYTLLPYLIVKAGTSWTRYNFNPNNQSFGDTRLNSLAVLNNATIGGTLGVTGAISGATVNTGQGATEVYLMDQNLRKTDNVSFKNINPPVDNDDNSMPNIGIGGFTFGFVQNGNITLPPFGTIMVIAFENVSMSFIPNYSGRISGGSVLEFTDYTPTGYVFAWRIA
jgi:hypothetical protein